MFFVSHSMFSVTHNMSKRKTVPVHQLLGFSHRLIFFGGGCLGFVLSFELVQVYYLSYAKLGFYRVSSNSFGFGSSEVAVTDER